jgi:hypothetical protein
MREKPLEWRVWPLRDRPMAGLGAALVVAGTAVGAALLGEHVGFGLFALAVMVGSLNPFFSPTRFRLDPEKAEARRWAVSKVRPWGEIRTCFVDRYGVTLSPFAGKAFLEPYRALRLFFRGNRDDVLAYVRAHLREETRVVELADGEGKGARRRAREPKERKAGDR